ncbi:O-antigen ligase family protein [Bacillus cereus group sp. BfR-BA-01380]|uniref:O-antigen ligase family protein n=1 Tax=Bacillus cereus group sp. BfR-BA-01380 TaxID=2920324 RepID=UPI001F5A4B1E|nr:O-antigen ligase family protein [Bacillus cereus group sp. BfR-BA-01380]
MLNHNSLSYKFERFLLIFIILQPIIDLLTSFCILVLKVDATVGVITRLFVMALGGIYILTQARMKENRKYIIYLLGLGIVLGLGFLNNKMIKHPMLQMEDLKFIAKALYPFVMISCYILVFKSLKMKETMHTKMRNSIAYAALIINVTMVAAIVTRTDYNSYDYFKEGSRGWFFAGNELGSILAIICPVVVLYSIEKTTSLAKSYFWIPSLLIIFSLFAIGTKVGAGAIVCTFVIAIFMCFIQAFLQRKERNKKPYLLNSLIATVIFAGVVGYFPFSPIYKNTSIHVKVFEKVQREQKQHDKPGDNAKEKEKEKQAETQALIFSGRELFTKTYEDFYKQAPMSQKLLGMGYGGNFKEPPKLIERDFHDWFYTFGVIGFIFLMIPFVYYGLRILVALVTRFREVFTVRYALLVAGLMLALGIAYTAGHVLTAPGVSIYFVVLLAYLIVDLEIE